MQKYNNYKNYNNKKYSQTPMSQMREQLITLPSWVLVLLFVAPLVIAFVIYINWNKIYFAQSKKIESVSPSFNLQAKAHFDMDGKLINIDPNTKHWNIIYLTPKKCLDSCEKHKKKLVKMYEDIGSKYKNINLFATPSQFIKIYNNSRYQALLLKEDNLIITDPDNKVVMHYDPNATTAKILEDLRILLKNKS